MLIYTDCTRHVYSWLKEERMDNTLLEEIMLSWKRCMTAGLPIEAKYPLIRIQGKELDERINIKKK